MGNQKAQRRYCLSVLLIPGLPEGNLTFQQIELLRAHRMLYCWLVVRLMFKGVWWLERSSSDVSPAWGVVSSSYLGWF